MFYVYEWFVVDTLEVFYVGKGTGDRRFRTDKRNQYFQRMINKHKCAVKVVKSYLTEEEAFQEEIKRIDEMKAIGWAVCNFTDGGEGISGLIHTEESRKRISENRSGQLVGEKNHNFGKPLSEETKRKLSQLLKGRWAGEKNPMFGKPTYGFQGKKHSEETKQKISLNRKGKGARFGKDNPMFGKEGHKGEKNGMYGKTGFDHPHSKMYKVEYLDGKTEVLRYKECEKKFGIAFSRIYLEGGTLHYKKKTTRSVYEGVKLTRLK